MRLEESTPLSKKKKTGCNVGANRGLSYPCFEKPDPGDKSQR